MNTSKLILLLLLLLPVASFAKTQTLKGMFEQNGEGYFVNFGSKYRAQLYVGTLPPIHFKAQLKMSDSTCGITKKPIVCDYETNYGLNKANWVWVKHPKTSELHHEVLYRAKRTEKFHTMEGNISFDTLYAPVRHQSDKHAEDKLVCETYDWIPKEARDAKMITSWYSSNMAKNTETGESENRALAGLVGLKFEIADGKMILGDYEEAQTFPDFFLNPFEYDQQTMIFAAGKKNCQVNWFRQVAASESQRFFDEKMKPITAEKPVPLKATNYFTENQVRAAIYEWTKNAVEIK